MIRDDQGRWSVMSEQHYKIEGLLRPDEVCNALQISTAKFYRLVISGRLPAMKIGSTWRVKPSTLSKWIKTQSIRIALKSSTEQKDGLTT